MGFGLLITMLYFKCGKTEYTNKRKVEIMKAIGLETGLQNSTLAIAMITLSFGGEGQKSDLLTPL